MPISDVFLKNGMHMEKRIWTITRYRNIKVMHYYLLFKADGLKDAISWTERRVHFVLIVLKQLQYATVAFFISYESSEFRETN